MNITYRQMKIEDIEKVIPLFIEYWNSTGDKWTYNTTYRRIRQVVDSYDSYCMLAFCNNEIVGFAMGRFETFFDLTAYDLAEIIIASKYQNKGIGTSFMTVLEQNVKQMGASMVQLLSVNDELHKHFYGKLGYNDCKNLKIKAKSL